MERMTQLMEWWIDGLLPWLEPVILSAGYASLLAVIILVINVAFRRWLCAGQMALLWGLVLVRLALPAAPSSAVSLGSLWDRATAAVDQLTLGEPAVFPAAVTAAPDLSARDTVTLTPYESPQPDVVSQGNVPVEAEADPLWMTLIELLACTTVVVFPFVATGIVAWTGFVHWRLCLFMRRQSPTEDERLLRVLAQARSLANSQRSIRLYAIPDQQQPAVMGIRSPAILLPLEAVDLPDDRLRLLLLHELAHVRRGDVLINWLLAALKVAHWWNPVFWLAASRFGALREQACDAFAVAKGPEGSTRDYGEILLHFSSTAVFRSRWLVSIPASLLGISPARGKSAMRRRLQALRLATRRHSYLQRGRFAALAVVLAISGWTEAKDIERPAVDPWIPLPIGTWDQNVQVQDEGDVITRDIDVSDALERHRELGLTPEISEKAVVSLIEMMLRATAPDTETPVERERNDLRIEGSTLKLTARQAVVDEISRLVEIWGQTGFRQICLECRIIRAESDLASELGVGWKSMGQLKQSEPPMRSKRLDPHMFVGASATIEQPLPVCVAALNKSQALQFVRTAQGDRKSNILFAPKVTVFNGVSARLSTVLEQPFVVGVQETDAGELKPTIRSFEEGLTLSLRPTESSQDAPLNLTGRLELSDISDVTLAAARTKSGRDVNIQIPRLQRVCIDIDSTIEDDESLLIGCLPTYERREFVYLLITAKHLRETDTQPPR